MHPGASEPGAARVVLVRSKGAPPPAWAGPDLRVVEVFDPRRLPFVLESAHVDVVVTAMPLPASARLSRVPVVAWESVPPDPGAARTWLLHWARQGAPPSPPPDLVNLLPRDTLARLNGRLLPETRQALQRLTGGLDVLAHGAGRLGDAVPPTDELEARRRAWSEAPSPAPPQAPILRRRPAAPASPEGGAHAVVILVGPVERLGDVEDLADALDEVPGLAVQFRLFREGMYRVDGRTDDVDAVARRLLAHGGVASLSRDGSTLHLVPSLR